MTAIDHTKNKGLACEANPNKSLDPNNTSINNQHKIIYSALVLGTRDYLKKNEEDVTKASTQSGTARALYGRCLSDFEQKPKPFFGQQETPSQHCRTKRLAADAAEREKTRALVRGDRARWGHGSPPARWPALGNHPTIG